MDSVLVKYINMDKKIERNLNTINKLTSLGFNKNNITRFSAIDGKNAIIDLSNKNYINSLPIVNLSKKSICIREGVFGCFLSHYFLLTEISNDDTISDDSIIFIFEDDFFINNEYLINNSFQNIVNEVTRLNKTNQDSIIYLGGRFHKGYSINNNNINQYYVNIYNNFYKRVGEWFSHKDRTTHNYIINKKSAKTIINVIDEKYINNPECLNIPPIDEILNDIGSTALTAIDYFPHIFYSPADYDTDIQRSFTTINTNQLKL